MTDTNKPPEIIEQDSEQKDLTTKTGFQPLLYNFRIAPVNVDANKFALQLPFSVLFDNLITVLWSMYGKEPKIKCGINQLRWALELLKCFRVDYRYPDSIVKIVKDLEKQIIELYAKLGGMLQKMKAQRELEEEKEIESEDVEKSNEENVLDYAMNCVSYNEKDVMNKLNELNIPIDIETGEPKALKELNSLGGKKSKSVDRICKLEKKTSKTHVIGALQKILNTTTEETTISEVEELIKGLKLQNSTMVEKKSSNNK
uniref:Uncharacterized protein n=1 Tax=Sipha flava TaxID=143950 RepID=A0A2S2R7B7_9HEMI